MAGADESYFPRPENRKPVFGNGSPTSPYFEGDGGAADTSRQLELPEDVRLPWLEGDDEDYENERHGGIGQGLVLGALGLLALLVIAGGVIWAVKSRPSPTLVADGGVIAAPKTPYKVRPSNPGGEVVAGTGDTSFAVAEGQSRSPQIDKSDDTPAPGFTAAGASSAEKAEAAPAGGVGVQIGAYANRDQAEAGWATLKSQYEPLGAVNHRIVQGKADIGTVYRLQAVPGDSAAARSLCAGMKAAGLSCQVKN
ncbi:SPOR domain-containing protein [Novosphingobium sp. Leaf2]|uniref:SPOR domain-containing protein n=1 Tax=Novosphingobium sp. Leaf2 TaxID=1735670 RepID=UPI0006F1F2FA|nr:SPOR domain-containing protein [Novosphingobium sp. Leaf2]KQM22171.1 sporulation protein [Novosphingobium sp. Leaf2]